MSWVRDAAYAIVGLVHVVALDERQDACEELELLVRAHDALGRRRARDKLAVYTALWTWHLLLCRPRWGFEPGTPA